MKEADLTFNPQPVLPHQTTVAEMELIPFFNLSVDMFCIVDADGFFRRINPAFEQTLGYKREELLTRPLTDFVHSDDVEMTQKELRKVMLGVEVLAITNRFRCKDGAYKWLSWRAHPIHASREGGVLYAVIRDVTEEKEVDRMKTEFISLASHQLRTPLSAIKWFTEMLLSGDGGELSGKQREMLDNVARSTERMIDLVNSLLNISRIESGRLLIDPKPTRIENVANDVVTELKVKLAEKRQIVKMEVEADLSEIDVDPKLIRHVFLNLLTNSIKYSGSGKAIFVSISQKGEEIVIRVSDEGYGIPRTEHKKVFQKFFRAYNVVKIETEGTGLGLYLARAIIEASGGKMWFESEEDRGASFYFSLPIHGKADKRGDVALS